MKRSVRAWSTLLCFLSVAFLAVVHGQSFGPTSTATDPSAGAWPARPPQRIYVMAFSMDPALQAELEQHSGGVLPQGPIRQMMADRPRVVDMVTGNDRSQPVGVTVAKLVADEMAKAGWPAVFGHSPHSRRLMAGGLAGRLCWRTRGAPPPATSLALVSAIVTSALTWASQTRPRPAASRF